MGTTKTENFTDRQLHLAKLLKALGHPARLAILEYLAEQQNCVCGNIVDALPLSQSTVSQHLKELKEAGLIQGEISGAKTCYCIDPKGWDEARILLTAFFDANRPRTSCC